MLNIFLFRGVKDVRVYATTLDCDPKVFGRVLTPLTFTYFHPFASFIQTENTEYRNIRWLPFSTNLTSLHCMSYLFLLLFIYNFPTFSPFLSTTPSPAPSQSPHIGCAFESSTNYTLLMSKSKLFSKLKWFSLLSLW